MIARAVVPENHPAVRLVEGTIAGDQSGLLWLVVEYDDLADLARVAGQMADNEDIAAAAAELAGTCPAVSTSMGTQLYYHAGT